MTGIGAPPAASIGAARNAMFEVLPEPSVDEVELTRAAGRILCEDIAARESLWPFARSAMDGIAVRFADIENAAREHPAVLPLAGTAFCGDRVLLDLPAGHAVRIATGAALPRGADTVVRQEIVRERGDAVLVERATRAGEHVFPAGEDAKEGEIVLERGMRLNGAHVALLAALGVDRVPVYAPPTVAILATGDELVDVTMPQGLGRVRDSNSHMLAAEIESAGLRSRQLGIVPDDPTLFSQAAEQGVACNALVVCGGASVGTRDVVRPALRALGVRFIFEGVPMKPGHPVAFGMAGRCAVFVLPGTPGACRVAFEVFVRPALLSMSGARQVDRPQTRVRLADTLHLRSGRARFLWARFEEGPLGPWARVLDAQGTAVLRSSAQAQLLLRIEPHQELLPAGATVPADLLDAQSIERVPAPVFFAAAVAIVGQKNAGKTTLIERLAPLLRGAGVRVGMIKHHSHQGAIDDARRDTGRAASAGVTRTLLTGPRGIVDRIYADEPGTSDSQSLERALRSITDVDLVFVEGFAESALPRILVVRRGISEERRIPSGPYVAVVGDVESSAADARFTWDRLDALAAFIRRRFVPERYGIV